MLCIFGARAKAEEEPKFSGPSKHSEAAPRNGAKRRKTEATKAKANPDDIIKKLGTLADSLPTRLRAYVEEEALGEDSGIS